VEIFTIGFAQKPASIFFGGLKDHRVGRLMDVRLNNKSQLAGFTKQGDLEYFLRELCGATYVQEPLLAPTSDMLKAYRAKRIDWTEYEDLYTKLISDRHVEQRIDRASFETPTVLLCSELKPDRCHRRLAADYLARAWGDLQIVHL
jgi:uncharacterized protein (DUF488 family)